MKKQLVGVLSLCLSLASYANEGLYIDAHIDIINTNIEANDFVDAQKISSNAVGVNTEESSIYPGVSMGFHLSDYLSLETGLKLHDYSYDILGDTEIVGGLTTVTDNEIEFTTLSLILAPVLTYPVTEKVNAYLSAGVHYWTTEAIIRNTEKSTGVDVGTGFRINTTVVTESKKTKNGADLYAALGLGYELSDELEIKLMAARLDSTIKSTGSPSINADYQSFSLSASYRF